MSKHGKSKGFILAHKKGKIGEIKERNQNLKNKCKNEIKIYEK